jgi:deoxyribodipyrimidine photo-lyase
LALALALALRFKPMHDRFAPTLAAAAARIATVQPDEYARTRNSLDGAVSGLSPYITHGFVTLADVLTGLTAQRALDVQHKFVFELGWRAYFRHVWQHRGEAILRSLREGPLPEHAYAHELPADICQARTGVPVVDQAVRTLYATGMLHNHARMWLASYVVHLRKVHWRAGADWMYGHLLDGDLASNHLSWQWVAGTGSSKPYLFNAENVARYASTVWHSPGSVIDQSYAALDVLARQLQPSAQRRPEARPDVLATPEPTLQTQPPSDLSCTPPKASSVAGRHVWIVHSWNLGALPSTLGADTVIVGMFVADFHAAWPWSAQRWTFVGSRMAELTAERWYGDVAAIESALKGARSVRSIHEPHLAPWLAKWAACEAAPALFANVDRRCDSFSQWWTRVSRGLTSTNELLAINEVPAW